jgi:lipopolysaccharide export system permease protein
MTLLRYFVSAILRGHVIVALGMLALFGLFTVMDEAGDIGKGDYTGANVLAYVAMTLPATLLDLAPFVILIGTIYGLSGFLRTHEITALRTAGFSVAGIATYALIATFATTGVLIPLELAARPMLQQAILYRTSIRSPDGNLLAREGSWMAREGTFVYVGSLRGGRLPSRVSVFEFGAEERELTRFVHAKDAEILEEARWRLRDVTTRHLGENGFTLEEVPEMDWQPIWSAATALQAMPIQSLTFGELVEYIDYLGDSGTGGAHGLELWRRVLMPLSGFAFALLGAALIVSVRPRSGGGLAILVGIGAAIGLYLFQQITMNTVLQAGAAPFVAVMVPTLVLVGIAVLGAMRANAGPRRP